MSRKRNKHSPKAPSWMKPRPAEKSNGDPDTEPDWNGTCDVCGASPIIPLTGMCGPCTWGEAETAGGNW